VIFVYTPEYIEGQKFISNRNDVLGIVSRFSTKYDIPFYDFSNDSITFQRQYFYNTMHLNKAGAEKFTNGLIGKLKESKLIAPQ